MTTENKVFMPQTMTEAFSIVDNVLKRHNITLIKVMRNNVPYVWLSDELRSCGKRVKFKGKTYSRAVIVHYLKTGVLLPRAPRAPRFKATVEVGKNTYFLGYYDSEASRDAAISAYHVAESATRRKSN